MDGTIPSALMVVGGGPVGTAAAIGLAKAGLPVRLLEARPALRAQDRRTLALTQGSHDLLKGLGAWPGSEVTPIDEIHVSQRGAWGHTLLDDKDGQGGPLGYVLLYNTLMACLGDVASEVPGLTIETGAEVTEVRPGLDAAEVIWRQGDRLERAVTPLVLVADGGRGLTAQVFGAPREKAYTQEALVAHVELDRQAVGRAYERFTPEGPIALLPMGDRYTLVWTGTRSETEVRLGWPEPLFLQRLQQAFGDRAGNFLRVQARNSFPLSLRVLPSLTRPHCVAIGNAAQTMHPVAGQGLNMGLRDAADVIHLVGSAEKATLGSAEQLEAYVTARRRDRRWGIAMTHSLVTLFSNNWPVLSHGRSLGLAVMSALPWTRRALTRVMSYGF